MRDRNAINFADEVVAPVLFVIGRNDSRCPYSQAMAYVDKLAAREHPHEVYVFETGHGSFDVDERVRQVRRSSASSRGTFRASACRTRQSASTQAG